MTSDTRDLTSEQPSRPVDRVQLSGVQVAASALASVSAAVVASLFGVAGTIVGAGLVAIISTTGSAIYSASMKRTTTQLRRAREQLLTARAGEGRSTRPGRVTGSTAVLDVPGRGRRSRSTEPDLDGSTPQSRWRRGWLTVGGRRGLKWPALVGAAVLVFAIAIGAITAFEALTKEPISALTGHSSSSSTTIGSLTGNSTASPTPTPASTENGSGSDADNTSPSAVPTTRTSPSAGSGATSSSSPSATASSSTSTSSPAPQNTGGTTGGSTSGGGAGSTGSTGSTGSGSTGSGTSGEITVP